MMTKQSIEVYRDSGRVLLRRDDFIYLLPHPALNKWISNYSITFPTAGLMSDDYTIMPHGSATLVFSCNERGITGHFFGPLTKPVCVGPSANACGLIFIVEFQPAGYFAFSKMPQYELTDQILFCGENNAPLHHGIAQSLERCDSISALLSSVERQLMAHLKIDSFHQAFLLANRMILTSSGQISVKELSQAVFYSERQLGRIFEQHLGVTAKSYSRLVRVNQALRLLHRPYWSIQRICLQTGFYDMPHFIHDFRAICGVTPQEYRAHMSDFYNEIAKF